MKRFIAIDSLLFKNWQQLERLLMTELSFASFPTVTTLRIDKLMESAFCYVRKSPAHKTCKISN